MIFLCLEGTTDDWSVALMTEEGALGELSFDRQKPMASFLVPAIRDVLQCSNKTLKEQDAIVISSGPGSYTGLRIVASTAKGLCLGSGRPLIAVPTLKSLSWQGVQWQKYDKVIAIMDARRQDVFCAIYDNVGAEILAPTLITLSESCFDPWLEGTVMVCGNGLSKIDSFTWASKVEKGSNRAAASSLFQPAMASFHRGEFENIASFSPFYMLPPNITQSKKV